MLELAKFISELGQMVAGAIGGFRSIRDAQREKQSKYLDSISETLASGGAAALAGENITKQISGLRFHLSSLEEVLRYSEPVWQMSMNDQTVLHLRAELDKLLKNTPEIFLSGGQEDEGSEEEYWEQRQNLAEAFF